MAKVAVIGAGLIGRAWTIVFLRGGYDVAVWDPAPGAASAARDFAAARLPELHAAGLVTLQPETMLGRLTLATDLPAALRDAVHVQENGPENRDAKRDLFAELDRLAAPGTVLASSTSTIPASAFAAELPGRHRCLVAHPVNPPYLVPVVELCPAPWTDGALVQQTRALMERAGMVPATIRREIPGFVLNRLQAALLGEAFRLVEDGIASAEDVDATIKHGLGLRWSFMGPFETIDLNAPAGLADYCARYAGPLLALREDMPARPWPEALVARLEADRRAALPAAALPDRHAWRDRRLMALAAHKQSQRD